MREKSALIIVDVQNDFCPGGALEVKEGDKIIPIINLISSKFYKVIATQDWHPKDHISFADNYAQHNAFDVIKISDIEQVLWPKHCVMGELGADFHPNLDTRYIDLIIRKGTNRKIDSYSAFFENDKSTITGLEGYLKALSIDSIYVSGLATDYCVFYTAMDGIKLGFNVYIVEDRNSVYKISVIQDVKYKKIKIEHFKDQKLQKTYYYW